MKQKKELRAVAIVVVRCLTSECRGRRHCLFFIGQRKTVSERCEQVSVRDVIDSCNSLHAVSIISAGGKGNGRLRLATLSATGYVVCSRVVGRKVK